MTQDQYEWLLNITIITNVLQRTILDVSFPFHKRKAANKSTKFTFASITGLHAAAILLLFALITHDPPTSAKSSILRLNSVLRLEARPF